MCSQVEAWTVRRCCAVALDIIGNTIHDELLPPFLPALQVRAVVIHFDARLFLLLSPGRGWHIE